MNKSRLVKYFRDFELYDPDGEPLYFVYGDGGYAPGGIILRPFLGAQLTAEISDCAEPSALIPRQLLHVIPLLLLPVLAMLMTGCLSRNAL